MRTYKKTLLNLKHIVNSGRSRKGQNIGQEFKGVVKELNDDFGQDISTKFLRALISLEKSNRQKSHRIKYLICKGGLKTRRQNRYLNGWIFQKWNTDITEYAHKENGLIYFKDLSLTEDEARQVLEINEVKNKSGIELNQPAEENLKHRQNRRTAINKGGGVYIKDVKNQQIGRFFKSNSKEVLYFIEGF